MDTDELRETIWEDLFRTKVTKSIDQLAAETNCNVEDVRTAVSHEWFTLAGDRVSIAYVSPSHATT
jgi:predicted amino acid-binding ACT domain protein